MDISVSVIIPTFNRAHLISETIDTIINQSFKPSEIIVVDDGSSDDTENVIKKYSDNVKYVKIVNSGVCKARNVGVDTSRSDWIAFCDSDDLWHKDKLLKQFELIHHAPEVEYCFTNFQIYKNGQWSQKTKFDESPNNYWNIPRVDISSHSFIIKVPFYPNILKFQPIFPSTILMSKQFFAHIGKFDESFGRKMSEDFEFTLRCVQEKPIGVIAEPLVGIRWHESNFSKGNIPVVSFIVGDIEILDYSMKNHHLGSEYKSVITDQIIKRSIDAAHGAFAYGDFKLVKDLLKNIPKGHRSIKLWVKAAVSQLCLPMARLIQKSLLSLRNN